MAPSLPKTPDKREIPKWAESLRLDQQDATRLPGVVGKYPFCVCVRMGGCQEPSLPPPSFQTRPIQSEVALKNQAPQQPGRALTREGLHPAPGSPHPCPGSVCTHRHPLWALRSLCIFVLLIDTQQKSAAESADPGAHLGLLPGGLEMLDASPDSP